MESLDPLLDSAQAAEKKPTLYPALVEQPLDKEENSEQDAATLPVVLAVLAVSFGCYIQGTSIVFPDTALAGIKESAGRLVDGTNSTELGYEYDETQDKAWIMAIAAFGMVAGGLLTGPLINAFGRRVACVLGVAAVFGLSYTLFLVASHVAMLYLARFLAGLGLGVSQALSTVYISEVSTPQLRSNMAVIPAMTGCLGVYSCQLLAYCLHWTSLATIFAACNLPFLFMVAAMPESPVFLVSKGRQEEAHAVLRRLRGPRWNVTRELAEIRCSLQVADPPTRKASLGDWLQPATLRALVVAFTLMFFFQMSGINLMLTFAITIFSQVGNLNVFLSQICVGSSLFVSNLLTLGLAGLLPRRIMLLSCSLGLSLTLAIMGFCFQIDDWERTCEQELSNLTIPQLLEALPPGTNVTFGNNSGAITEFCSYGLGLLPIFTAMVYIFMFNIGYGSLVWMTATEILPAHIRSSTNGLTVGWTGVMSFLTSFSFPFLLKSSMGGQGCFWMYSVVSFLGFIFIGVCVPETSGKTEAEISALFQREERPGEDAARAPPRISCCAAMPAPGEEN